MESDPDAVQLEPFVHQVGGHSCVFCFDDHTLCKPLISREHRFYETMPDEMKLFTPEYRGVVEVTFQEDSQGYVNLVAYPVDEGGSRKAYAGNSPNSGGDSAQSDSDSETSSIEQTPHKQRIRFNRSGSVEIETDPKSKPLNEHKGSPLTSSHNPWSLRCHKEQLTKMRQSSSKDGTHKFILLENLASHFRLPCILDLKMGTRQHGDDTTEEKRRRHMRKCQLSTSSSLGVRICGMQVHQADTGCFVCHDKYYGQKLTVQGFHQTLWQFLHNGKRLRCELLEPIVSRLEQLRHQLDQQDSFRFYSSSLLIMYDGYQPSNSKTHESSPNNKVRSKPAMDDSYKRVEMAASSRGYSTSTDYFNGGETSSCGSRQGTKDAGSSHRLSDMETDDFPPPPVDIRMIDFAHATHKGFYRDDIEHSGPDRGYLLGLDNLIKAFYRLRNNGNP